MWISLLLAGALSALLYGSCARCPGTHRHYDLASLYPAVFPNLTVLAAGGFFAMLAEEGGNHVWVAAGALALLVPTLWLTVAAWHFRRPRFYLASVATAGIPQTMVAIALWVVVLTSPSRPGLFGLDVTVLCIVSLVNSAIGIASALAAVAGAWMMRSSASADCRLERPPVE